MTLLIITLLKIKPFFWRSSIFCCLLFQLIAGVTFAQERYLKRLDWLKNQPQSSERDSLVVEQLYALSKIITPKQEFWTDSLQKFSIQQHSPIGKILWEIMEAEKAIRKLNFQEGIKIHLARATQLEKTTYKKYASWPYLRAGILFARINAEFIDKKDALIYYEKALEITKAAHDTSEIIRAYDYIGEYYLDNNQLEDALKNLLQAKDLIEKFDDKNLYPTILASLGSCYLLKKNEEKAQFYYKKMNFWLFNGGIEYRDFYQSYIKNIYYYGFGLYYFKEKKYDKVIDYARNGYEAMKAFQKVKNKRTFTTYALDHLKILYESYAQLGNYKNAFFYQNEYNSLLNASQKTELDEKLQELNTKYRSEQQQNKIIFLENEQRKADEKKQTIMNWFLAGLSVLLSIGLGFAYWSNRKIKAQNKEISEALLKGQTIERKRVAADLHDSLGSTMSSLIWTLEAINTNNLQPEEKELYQHLKTMLHGAYDEVRMLSHNLLPEEFEKQGLGVALQTLVRKINKNSAIEFMLKIDESIMKLDKKTEFELYSICLELVNNIIKHSKASKAIIELSRTEKQIQLMVSDNGIGIFHNNCDGKGMKNVKARVESLNGNWTIKEADNKGITNLIKIPS